MRRRYRKGKIEGQALLIGSIFIIAILISVVQSIHNWWIHLPHVAKDGFVIMCLIGVITIFLSLIVGRNHIQRVESTRRQQRIFQSDQLSEIRDMHWREFELFVADLFTELGYKAQVTQRTSDGGKDIILNKGRFKAIVECKRYKEANNISVNLIRQFHSVIMDTHSDHGYFVTTSDFTKDAYRYVQDKPIELINGERLIDLKEGFLKPDVQKSFKKELHKVVVRISSKILLRQ
jgi:restriction system protein